MIDLRPATTTDEALLLAWANDPITRTAGFRPEPIAPDDHHRWLRARLSSSTGRLLIGISSETPIGQVRLDRDAQGRVEIGISVAPDERGRGLGRSLLAAALRVARDDERLRPVTFIARIRPDNAVSIALFEGAGFRLREQTSCEGVPCLVFELPA